MTIVNLNRARKDRAKAQSKAQAAENRVAFGRTKSEKAKTKLETAKAERTLDGAKRED